MNDLSILWVAAVLVAVIGLATPGCASTQVASAKLPPIPSHSDTNTFHSGSIGSSVGEVSPALTDNPSIRGSGTTGQPSVRR